LTHAEQAYIQACKVLTRERPVLTVLVDAGRSHREAWTKLLGGQLQRGFQIGWDRCGLKGAPQGCGLAAIGPKGDRLGLGQ
jgi:hypothetical protein